MHVETYAVAALEQHRRPESRTGRSHARATAVRILAATINKTNTTRNSPWHELWNERCSLGFRVSGFL